MTCTTWVSQPRNQQPLISQIYINCSRENAYARSLLNLSRLGQRRLRCVRVGTHTYSSTCIHLNWAAQLKGPQVHRAENECWEWPMMTNSSPQAAAEYAAVYVQRVCALVSDNIHLMHVYKASENNTALACNAHTHAQQTFASSCITAQHVTTQILNRNRRPHLPRSR